MGNWDGKKTLKVEYAYSGQGLTGTTSSLEDLQNGRFVDTYDIPPQSGASGFDGTKAWEKEPSGTVTDQAGGDVIPLRDQRGLSGPESLVARRSRRRGGSKAWARKPMAAKPMTR